MAKQQLSFKLKKNPQDQILPVLGRTAANLGGYTAGKFLNKNITSEKIKPVFKGLAMLAVGMAAQLVDNQYVEASGLGMTTAGFDVFIGNTSSAKVKEYAARVGLSGTNEEEADAIDWDEAYEDADLDLDTDEGPEYEDMDDDQEDEEDPNPEAEGEGEGMSGTGDESLFS